MGKNVPVASFSPSAVELGLQEDAGNAGPAQQTDNRQCVSLKIVL